MAQEYVTDAATLIIPGSYPDVKVQKNNSGLSTTGVLMLVGEADAGPDHTLEADLAKNVYGPDQASAVLAKYGSGPLVDAYRAAQAPANDPDIKGSPSAFVLVKTNVSTKASKSLLRSGMSAYGTLAHRGYGKLGNMTYAAVTASASEVAPTTGAFTYIPGPEVGSDGSIVALRVNGGAEQTLAVSSRTLPSTLVGAVGLTSTGLNSLSGIMATGGIDRGVLTGLGVAATLAIVASGNNVTITLGVATAWTTTPSAGDTLIIPDASLYGKNSTPSVIDGASDENLGAYVVTSATSTTISATKLRDDTTSGVTGPATVSAVALGGGTDEKDIMCFSPVVIKNMTGVDRNILTGLTTKTITGSISGSNFKFTLQTGYEWAALPQAGDLLFMPDTAPDVFIGSSTNGGWYQVVSATTGTGAGASTIIASRLSDGTAVAFGATAIAATTDLQCLRPVKDGTGKSLEIYDDAGVFDISTIFFATNGTAVSWISTASVPYLLTSSSEYASKLIIARQTDGVSEEVVAGGSVVLKLGYAGTTATATITNTKLTTSVVGGNGDDLDITLKDFKTVADLANYINSQTGYTCAVGNTLLGQQLLVKAGNSVLDQGTYGIASDVAATPGRIKRDAYAFFQALSTTSILTQLGTTTVEQADSGLPEVQATFYLSGGSKGGSTGAQVAAAIDALEKVKGNFVITCFARDASADIEDDLTESSSSYVIDDINAAVKTHVLKMSTIKRRRNRQGFVAKKDTFLAAKEAANNLSCFRLALCPQDFKTVASDSTITQFGGYIGAALAAGMQAAGFYRSIMHKGINCSGVLMADGSYHDQDDTQVEDALKNGLLVAERVDTGGFRWVSDQTTYAADSNFVYNSVQAIYAADTVSLTTAQRMEKAFVGQSLADVSAAVALTYLKAIMSDLKRLKLLASSDDAPLGFRNAVIKIQGNAMIVSIEIKLATAIAFIPISFLVTEVQQTATA